jgi:pimeloyl-ACP methyl ester carboxylesterase
MPYYITPEGPEIFYRAWGKGPVALFFHPIMHDGTEWLSQLEGLSDIRTCVAVDLRGHGKSDPSPKPQISLNDHIRDMTGFIDTVYPKGQIDLCGLAFGGNLAALLYEQRPQRMRSLTMISSNFAGGPPDAGGKRYVQELARHVVVDDKGIVFRRWLEYIVSPTASLHAKARYRSMVERTPSETMVSFLNEGLGDQMGRPDLPAKLKLPVFIPVGADDGIINMNGPLKDIPNLHTARLASAGRLLPLEAPDELNAALRKFWTSI